MANILSTSQIVQKFIDFYKTSQPNLSTQPGSVARDLFVDGVSIRIAELYNNLSTISSAQSITQSVGTDLENLASNYAVTRTQPGKSSGNILLTFNSIFTDIVVPAGGLVYSRNGMSFRIIAGMVIASANSAQYKAVATTYRSDLDYVGITDNYAVQVSVECTTTGIAGNIPKYNIYSVSIPGISGVTNIAPFAGGSSEENDASYQSRILSVFSGSNTGTALGYKNTVMTDSSVLDAVVVVPGDPLMTRDGTLLETDSSGDLVIGSDGEPIIISEGTGGKVDIFIYGRRLTQNIDSLIYVDKSGKNDPTQSVNDFTIGQISGDENKTITKRRLQNISVGTLPNQPVFNIVEVVGSLSGTFTPQVIDIYGNSYGNYSLLKDTGTYAGSPFGFDKLHWVRNYITTTDDTTKNLFNGQDSLLYPDVTEIQSLTRTILVTNENSDVSQTNKSQLILKHTPIASINKVLNYTTGERYVVSDRNPNGNSGDLNTTGIITISGKNLPSASDILQVDYEWEYSHDVYNDVDSFTMNDNPRTALNVVDWGYGNAIRREPNPTLIDGYTISVVHNISSVISVNKVLNETKTVSVNTTGLGLIITGLSQIVTNVISIRKQVIGGVGAEVYNTKKKDGSFDGNRISLPTDTPAQTGDAVIVVYNAIDLYTSNGLSGNFANNTIYLNGTSVSNSDILEVNYIANINELLPSTNLSSLPATKLLNGFRTSSSGSAPFGVQPVTNIYLGQTQVTKNLRKDPTKLGINISGITNNGVLGIRGKTSQLLADIVFTNVNSGLTIDLAIPIKAFLGIDNLLDLPSNLKLSRLISLEKVETLSSVVTNVLTTYDITGYGLKDNSLALDESIIDTSLSVSEILLPTTTTNINNEPILGDQMRATFYITFEDDTESISFSSNGTLYSNKSYVYINSLSISSGFKNVSAISGTVSLFALSQPQVGNRYKTSYKYTAPKNGERITVTYNNNALIGDLTFTVEKSRPVTADVIVKSASSILVDVYATITVLKSYSETGYLVAQNVGDKISSYINNLTLGAMVHPSDIINIAYQVTGLDSIVISRFNQSNMVGNVAQIVALRNQYMQANNIQITLK